MNAHGEFQLSYSELVFVAALSGSWNAEGSEALFAAFIDEYGKHRPARWSLVLDFRHWEGATPEALAIGADMAQWNALHGMVVSAHVVSSSLHDRLLRPIVDELDTSIKVRSFVDFDEAFNWARLQARLVSQA